MKDINSTFMVGRLTREPESRTTNNGTSILSFSLAVNRSVKKGDRYEDEASFFDCQMFGKMAESLSRYLTKGMRVAVSGELQQQRWESDGQKRSKVIVAVRDLQMLDSKKDGSQGKQRSSAPEDFESDSIPF